jgi:alcohol dehydrogenase
MFANVFHGPGNRAWEEVPDPHIGRDTDIIVRVDVTTICGTDLHILRGDVPEVKDGRILGHEAAGTVLEVGAGVRTVSRGDRVLLSCITSCGMCENCRHRRYGLCTGGGGWILGHLIDGTQAEQVLVPYADHSVHKIPDTLTSEQMLLLADILPTSYEVGALNGAVQPADVVVIVGMGPIGLAATLTTALFSPRTIVGVDVIDSRLETAAALGADVVVNSNRDDPRAVIDELTDGLGADVSIEAVGLPETFELAVALARRGGHVANVGVHGRPATFPLHRIWDADLTVTTGLVDTFSIPTLSRLIQAGKLDASALVSHRYQLDEIDAAYDTFADAAATNALKVVLNPPSVDVHHQSLVGG